MISTAEQIQLNEEQLMAVEAITEFLETEEKEFLLTGRAGTGKTTTIGFIKFNRMVIGMATSHKAKEVLRESLPTYNIITVASAIGTEKVDDLLTGNSYFAAFGKDIVREKIIFIVDECSMIDNDTRKKLLELYPNSKFIYLGDKHQLPPINAVGTLFNDNISSSELLKNMRTGSTSPIMNLLNSIISLQKQEEQLHNITMEDIYNILPSENIEIEDKLLLCNYPIGQFYRDFGNTIILTYHVKKKEAINDMFREKVLSRTERYEIGDKLIFNNSIYKEGPDGPYRVFTNSEIVTIAGVTNAGYKFNASLKTSLDTINISINMPYFIISVDEKRDLIYLPSDIKEVQNKLTKIKAIGNSEKDFTLKKKIFKDYYKLLYAFYDVSYGYAITSHKSQGSTYDNVIVDFKDIFGSNMSMLDKLKCFYVACSRAKYILNILS